MTSPGLAFFGELLDPLADLGGDLAVQLVGVETRVERMATFYIVLRAPAKDVPRRRHELGLEGHGARVHVEALQLEATANSPE